MRCLRFVIGGVIVATGISVVVACAGLLYYCNKYKEYLRDENAEICDDISEENRTKRQSKNSSSSIVNEQRNFNKEHANRETITSAELERRKIFPPKTASVVPVRPPRRRREASRTSYDSPGQFSSIESRRSSTNNESTEASCVIHNGRKVKLVKARIESHPRGTTSSSNEIPNSLESKSSIHLVDSSIQESTLRVSGERSTVTLPDAKNDCTEKVKTRKTINATGYRENNETEGSNRNVQPGSSSQCPSCNDRSMMLQANRAVNASTSTKISSHIHELKEFDSEQLTTSVQEIWKRSCNIEENSTTILREILSFLNQEEKDCALELSMTRARNDEEKKCDASRDDDSSFLTIQIRKYQITNGNLRDKPKSSESRLMKVYRKLSGRTETKNTEKSCLSSKQPSRSRRSSVGSICSLSSAERSSYYAIRLSEVDQAILQEQKRKIKRKKKCLKLFQRRKSV